MAAVDAVAVDQGDGESGGVVVDKTAVAAAAEDDIIFV